MRDQEMHTLAGEVANHLGIEWAVAPPDDNVVGAILVGPLGARLQVRRDQQPRQDTRVAVFGRYPQTDLGRLSAHGITVARERGPEWLARSIERRLFLKTSLSLGALALLATPREEEPQIRVPMVDVMVAYPGAEPAEVASRVVEPIESRREGVHEAERQGIG